MSTEPLTHSTYPDQVLGFINALRDSFSGSVELFTRGHCFELFLILRQVWPTSEAWLSLSEGHVFVKIGTCWYDIRGRWSSVPEDAAPMSADQIRVALRWGRQQSRFQVINQAPEPSLISRVAALCVRYCPGVFRWVK